jgi:hypothetical protein
MGLMEAIEGSAYSEWVRSSPSFFAYTFILSLHAMGLALIVGLNTVIALRLLGFVPQLPVAPLRKLYPWMYVGFTVNAFSGGSLLMANLEGDLGNWMFLAKLGFIALAMVNLELTRMKVFDAPGGLSSAELPRHARTFAIASLVLWGLATVSGRLTAYPNFVQTVFGFGA